MECGENADCVPRENSKSMVGMCQCKEGFVFDTGGNCIQAVLEKTVITLKLWFCLKALDNREYLMIIFLISH